MSDRSRSAESPAVWVRSYPAGVPAEIDPTGLPSLLEVLEQAFAEHGDLPAYTCMGRTLTFRDVDRKSRCFAAFLQAQGIEPGDRVALMMPNLLQYPIALFGVLRAGAVAVNVNPLYTARELEHQLCDAEAKAIVVVDNFAAVLAEVLPDTPLHLVVTTGVGDELGVLRGGLVNFVLRHVRKLVPTARLPAARRWRQALAADLAGWRPVPRAAADLAFLQYTGGTTGVAKGAMLSHGNMVANVLQVEAWVSSLERGGERLVTALPLYHIFAMSVNCLTFLRLGAHNLLVPNPRDLAGFVRLLRRWPFSVLTGVNTLFNGLLHTEGFDAVDFSGLKVCLGGGMAVQKGVADRWQHVTGRPLLEGYGLTEASPVVCVNRLDVSGYTGSIGLPIPSTEVAILDDDNRPVATGEVGELCVRGPQVMQGYWRRQDETAKVLIDGWLHTGDLGTIDADGYLRIVDRKKDMIVVSGFKVFPNEIEDVLASLPGVLESGAVGVVDDQGCESVKVVVVRRDPRLTESDVIAHCRANLTKYKVPRIVEFRDSLPKTNVGKILRRALR